jgi:hypothetical protein
MDELPMKHKELVRVLSRGKAEIDAARETRRQEHVIQRVLLPANADEDEASLDWFLSSVRASRALEAAIEALS